MSKEQALAVHPDTRAAIDAFEQAPSHALALVGAPGLGKAILAHQLAAKLLGLTDEMLAFYPYFRTIQPENGTISISTIREVRSFFTLVVPTRRKGSIDRVLLIEDADTMTREAQNSLLKLLEEPPEDSVCILTLSRQQRLLLTVRSRLQTIQVHAPHNEDILQALQGPEVQDAEISRALMTSGGNIAAAYSKLYETTESDEVTPIDLVKQMLAADTFMRLAMADRLSKSKELAGGFLESLVLVASASLQQAAKMNDLHKMQRWQKTYTAGHIAQTAYTKNANLKLLFTELMLSL